MKIVIISEDDPDGMDVNWPPVPRLGDLVSLSSRGGTTTYKVDRVFWEANGLGALEQVRVHLSY